MIWNFCFFHYHSVQKNTWIFNLDENYANPVGSTPNLTRYEGLKSICNSEWRTYGFLSEDLFHITIFIDLSPSLNIQLMIRILDPNEEKVRDKTAMV